MQRQQHNQPMSFNQESVPVPSDQMKPTPQNFQQQNAQSQDAQLQNSQLQNAQSQNVQSQNAEQTEQQRSLLEVDAPKTTPEDAKKLQEQTENLEQSQVSTQPESQSMNVQQQAPVVNKFNSQRISYPKLD